MTAIILIVKPLVDSSVPERTCLHWEYFYFKGCFYMLEQVYQYEHNYLNT